MKTRFACLLPLLCVAAGPAWTAALELPVDARMEGVEEEPLARAQFPTGPWTGNSVDMIDIEGRRIRQAWQVPGTGRSSLQLLTPLRDQVIAQGFEVVFECATRECGGFEFRYEMDLLPEPVMHVDLGDFRYLLASRQSHDDTEHVAILVSRSSERGFIHVTQTGAPDVVQRPQPRVPAEPEASIVRPRQNPDRQEPTLSAQALQIAGRSSDLVEELDREGRAVLSDLSFDTGSARLADRAFPSLGELAAWLEAHPSARILLVGHTDAEGALSGNIELSRKRASAVRDRLRETHGIAGERVDAQGVGYLAPLTSNETEQGRTLNRRVEVVLESRE